MKKSLTVQILLMVFCIAVSAQKDWRRFEEEAIQQKNVNSKKKVDLEQILKQSIIARKLNADIESGKPDAVYEATLTADKSLIPYLKWLIKDESRIIDHSRDDFQAQVLLIKLGDKETYQRILDDLNSSDLMVQDAAIRKLGQVNTKSTIKKLYELLDDESPRSFPDADDAGYAFGSKSEAARYALSLAVENPPIKKGNTGGSVQLWKDWFKIHKNLIE